MTRPYYTTGRTLTEHELVRRKILALIPTFEAASHASDRLKCACQIVVLLKTFLADPKHVPADKAPRMAGVVDAEKPASGVENADGEVTMGLLSAGMEDSIHEDETP